MVGQYDVIFYRHYKKPQMYKYTYSGMELESEAAKNEVFILNLSRRSGHIAPDRLTLLLQLNLIVTTLVLDLDKNHIQKVKKIILVRKVI